MIGLSEFIYEITFSSKQKVTEEMVDYFEKNPSELDLLLEEEDFQLGFLFVFFIVGLFVMVLTQSIQLFLLDYLPVFVTDVLLEILLEIGKALLGGSIVAYFIEFLRHKQFKQNKAIRDAIKRRLDARAASKSNGE